MCGIAGFIDKNNTFRSGSRQTDKANTDITKMVDVLRHRGPDGKGITIFSDKSKIAPIVALGHARLAILDLTEASRQPFKSECGNYHLTYNGEIYNYLAIKEKLEAAGHKFTSEGDTEVLLRACMEWGVRHAVHHFIGMFAFCFMDLKQSKAYLVRDRVGIKPLYYAIFGKLFLFASELKSLVLHSGFVKELNVKIIPTYLQTGNIPNPATIYENTYQVPPAHILTFDLKKNATAQDSLVSIEQYWQPHDEAVPHATDLTQKAAEERTEELLTSACEYRMVSDVPVGVFLSGGIDSSLVATLLAGKLGKKLKTFSIGFKDNLFDEAIHAKKIASFLKTDHHEHYLTEEDAKKIVPELPNFYDEPFADSSAIPTLFLSRFTHKEVKVALCGDGGDELFVGYEKYRAGNMLLQFPSWQKQILKFGLMASSVFSTKQIDWMWRNFSFGLSKPPTNLAVKMEKMRVLFQSKAGSSALLKYLCPYLEAVPPYMVASVFDSNVLANLNVIDTQNLTNQNIKRYFSDFNPQQKYLDDNSLLPIESMTLLDFHDYLVNDILVKTDRATMSTGLEGREPFLDHRLVEYAFSLSAKNRVNYQSKKQTYQPKLILKNILNKYLPDELWNRPKQGFAIPLDKWMRGDLKYLLDKYLSKERLKRDGIFNADAIEKTKQLFLANKFNNVSLLWFLVQFEMWKEKWL